MRRGIVVAAAAIALLCGGSVALLGWGTASAPAPAATTATALPMPRADAVHVPPFMPSYARAMPTLARAAQPASPLDPPSDRGSRRPGRVLSKALRRELTAPSGAVRTSLAHCARGARSREPAVLLLELESLDDEIQIVDAAVQTRGDASEQLIACAQATLRNRTIPAPGVRRGNSNRISLALTF